MTAVEMTKFWKVFYETFFDSFKSRLKISVCSHFIPLTWRLLAPLKLQPYGTSRSMMMVIIIIIIIYSSRRAACMDTAELGNQVVIRIATLELYQITCSLRLWH